MHAYIYESHADSEPIYTCIYIVRDAFICIFFLCVVYMYIYTHTYTYVHSAFPSTPGADSAATAARRLGEDVAVVCAASPFAVGAIFAVADFDASHSDTHHEICHW